MLLIFIDLLSQFISKLIKHLYTEVNFTMTKYDNVMEQQTGSKLGKEYIKAVNCHPNYLNICRVHHEKCQAG